MKFGYTIVYVAEVSTAIKFYSDAFGFATRFIHDGGDYAELDTGETTLAFAAHSLGQSNFPNGYTPLADLPQPAGIEVAFVTDDVSGSVARAEAAGATTIGEPVTKPWGQTVAYVRSPDGTLIELCTPVNS
ncbi:Virulence protein [Rubripirellula tenax]|uniref:Virulence protein n=1 Tax=Rubripirellula tenax TaxID=2528015 RepID=A0A5C6E6H5_9BACT|nr:VOC family protein [Rubripirellula tenax]TWU44542.1 Virulence protein [Rubripirellula tenax]